MKYALIAGLLLFLCTTTEASVPRKPLIEEMTSTRCTFCDLTDSSVDAYEAEFEGKLCMLKWHSYFGNYEGENPFYKAYPNGMKRLLCYNVSGVPIIIGNGLHKIHPNKGAQGIKDEFNPLVFGLTSPFTLEVTHTFIGDSLECTVTVGLVDAAFGMSNLRLGIVISEREVHFQEQTTAVKATKVHTNVVRATVPEFVNGLPTIPLPLSMSQGETTTFTYRIAINEIWNDAMLQTTAFIQDSLTKEVYQSGATAIPAAVASRRPESAVAYPNPTSGVVNIAYVYDKPAHARLTVYDVAGKRMLEKNEVAAANGEQVFSVDISHLPNGMYYYCLHVGEYIKTEKVLLQR